MLQEERFNYIMNALSGRNAIKVSDIARELSISQSTIRRDIIELSEAGKLRKVFGGAVSLEQNIDTVDSDVSIRAEFNQKEKDSIGKYAATLIDENDFVYIDAGTTTQYMIPYIDPALRDSVSFITNGLQNAAALVKRGFRVFLPGGELKSATQALVGAGAMEYIENCNFTKCFMGANGVDEVQGCTTPEMDEAKIKSQAIKHSYRTYVLCDSTKFDHISAVTFSRLNNVCIITDRLTNPVYRELTAVKEVQE